MTPLDEMHASLSSLASLDFTGRGEAYVESNFLTPLLHCLGYEIDTDYEVRRHGDEGSTFKLQYPPVEKGAKPVKQYNPDYMPTIRKKVFWVIEAKSPKDVGFPFQDAFVVQGLQYCIHPEIQAKYLVLSNGRDTAVYDAHGSVFLGQNLYEPIFTFENRDITAKWSEIYQLLSVETLRGRIEADLRKMFEKLCLSSLDDRYPDRLIQEIGKDRIRLSQVIRREVARLHVKSLQDGMERHQSDLTKQNAAQLYTMMNLPMTSGKCAGMHFVERSISEGRDLPSLIELLTHDYQRQSVFRKEQTFVALCALYQSTESEELKDGVRKFLDDHKNGELSALNRAECAALRVVRKVFVIYGYSPLRNSIDSALATAPELIRFVRPPTALDRTLAVELMSHHTLFEQLLKLNDQEWVGLATALEAFEASIDEAFGVARRNLKGNEQQIGGFEDYGAGGRLWSLKPILHNLGIETMSAPNASV